MKEQKLTAQDLALYWGQPCAVKHSAGLVYLSEIREGLIAVTPSNEITPILRRLSDMTEAEARYTFKIVISQDWYPSDGQCLSVWLNAPYKRESTWIEKCVGTPKVWRYLLSRGFDLFGWIEAGLAIDKTKLPENA